MFEYKKWQALTPGDAIEIIAPASACPKKEGDVVNQVCELLTTWGLKPIVAADMFGDDLLCANSDEQRLLLLKNALLNPNTKAVWCLRGGYGATRLLPELFALPIPSRPKIFLGMSDVTALHLFLQQHWHWITLHSPSARQLALNEVQPENLQEVKAILLGEQKTVEFKLLTPMNHLAQEEITIAAPITGGNLSLVQASLATSWQIDTQHKILFLEEINERGYRIDRMLQHLQQAGVFKEIKAIVFGDFIGGQEANGTSLVQDVLQRFAQHCEFPVLQCCGIGHGKHNRPLPLGSMSFLNLGEVPSLNSDAGFI